MKAGDYHWIDDKGPADGWASIAPSETICARRGKKEPAPFPNGCENDGAKASQFVARVPLYDLSRLVLCESARAQLESLKTRFATHALVYDEWGLDTIDPCGKHIAFNLYGPPGTGKTMCVEAIAKLLGKNIIDVSYAEIESKYVGETGKNIVAAFRAAQEQDALLFFDEADSILGQRMTAVTQSADQAVNVSRAVMLKQLDAFNGVVAFATNLAKNFDSAFVRRIPVHIEIPLPDEDGRRRIAEITVPGKVPFKSKIDFGQLANKTEGFSGGDIKNVVVNSISELAGMNWKDMEAQQIMAIIFRQVEWSRKAKRNVGRNVVVKEEEISLAHLDAPEKS